MSAADELPSVGRSLVTTRNRLSGHLSSIWTTATNLAGRVATAESDLAQATTDTVKLAGEPPSDPEYLAAQTLIAAAKAFVAAAEAARPTLGAPSNWRRGHAVDAALRDLNL
jgi:hypothetical protein